jgi:hypothetical protein
MENSLMRWKKAVLLGIGVCLCFAPNPQATPIQLENPVISTDKPSVTESSPWASTVPFEKTGLLAHPGETAAEILMRAHNRDPDAVLLATIGYTWGSCGFPPDMFPATAWAMQLKVLGKHADSSYANLYIWSAMIRRGIGKFTTGAIDVDCKAAQDSAYAPLFRNAGFIESDVLCREAEKFKTKDPNYERDYAERLNSTEKLKDELNRVATLMRELRSRPATLQEQDELIKFTRGAGTEIALFFAATAYNPEKNIFDRAEDHLPAFLTTQRMQLEKEHKAGREKMRSQFIELIDEAGVMFAQHTAKTSGDTAGLIGRAHLGDIPAIYAMSEHYAYGTAGFFKSRELSEHWLEHAALYMNREAAWALAVRLFARGELNRAWAWISILLEFLKPDEPTKENARRLLAEIEAVHGEKQVREREYLKDILVDESVRLVKWRLGK